MLIDCQSFCYPSLLITFENEEVEVASSPGLVKLNRGEQQTVSSYRNYASDAREVAAFRSIEQELRRFVERFEAHPQ